MSPSTHAGSVYFRKMVQVDDKNNIFEIYISLLLDIDRFFFFFPEHMELSTLRK